MLSFASHIMMNLRGSKLHYRIQGVSSEDISGVDVLDIDTKEGLAQLNNLCKQNFSSAVLSVYIPHKTLVPEGLFSQENLSDYLHFCYGEDLVDASYTNDFVRQIESYLVYQDHKDLSVISGLFPTLNVRHTLSILIEAHMRSTIANQNTEITVYSEGKYMEIIVSDKNQLLFCNNFQVHHPEDYTYYVVYILDVLGISTKDHLIRICGDTKEENITLLQKYCPQADHHRFAYDTHIGKDMTDRDYAQETVLINQYQCV